MTAEELTEAVIFSGGPAPSPKVADFVNKSSLVVAADSGLDNALSVGISPNVLIGDLDSISEDGLKWAQDHEIEQIMFPVDKDKSDLELALEYALPKCTAILIIDSGLGRTDQLYGLIGLLGSKANSPTPCRAIIADALVTVVSAQSEIRRSHNNVASIFAHGGDAFGVTTSGFRWNLDNTRLRLGSTLGLSNELQNDTGLVSVDEGTLLVIQPEIFAN